MTVIYVLIGVSVCLAVFFLIAFLWSIRSGQFDDDYTPSVRMLMDDTDIKQKQSNKSSDEHREV